MKNLDHFLLFFGYNNNVFSKRNYTHQGGHVSLDHLAESFYDFTMSIPRSTKQSSPLSSRHRSVTNVTPLLTPRHSHDNSSTQISSMKNTTSSSPSTIMNESSKRNKQNLVLSTSFISTKNWKIVHLHRPVPYKQDEREAQ